MEDQAISNDRPAALPQGTQTLIFGVLAAIGAAFALMPGTVNYIPWAAPYPIGQLAADSPAAFAALFTGFQWYAIAAALAFGILSVVLAQKATATYTANADQYHVQEYKDMRAGRITAYAALIVAVLVGFFAMIS